MSYLLEPKEPVRKGVIRALNAGKAKCLGEVELQGDVYSVCKLGKLAIIGTACNTGLLVEWNCLTVCEDWEDPAWEAFEALEEEILNDGELY